MGGGYGGGHIVYGAEGYGVEAARGRERFCAGGPDFYREIEGSNYLSEEGRLLILGFCKGYGDFGVKEGYGEAGEACP